MANPFSTFFHWLAEHLGIAEKTITKIWDEVKPFFDKAEEYALDLSQFLAANPELVGLVPAQALGFINTWLSKFVKDAEVVKAFEAANAGANVPALLHAAVVFAVAHTTNTTAQAKLLQIDTAVQLAYHKLVTEDTVVGNTMAPNLLSGVTTIVDVKPA